MSSVFQKLFSRNKQFKLLPATSTFVSKDNLFVLHDADEWGYTRSGNSYYFFTDLRMQLKGGIELSIVWNKEMSSYLVNSDKLMQLIISVEKQTPISEKVNNYPAFYLERKEDGSNLDFHMWYIFIESVYFRVRYYIYEEESMEIKSLWLSKVTRLIQSLEIKRSIILDTKFKK